MLKAFVPDYPPIARQARIAGKVNLEIRVRQDGSVESAGVVSGPVILRQVALEGARQSAFDCESCGALGASYSLTYKFEIVSRDPPENCIPDAQFRLPADEVDLAQHQITVFAWQLSICDPAARKVRSARCLYLWKCGFVEIR